MDSSSKLGIGHEISEPTNQEYAGADAKIFEPSLIFP
jgi:hypothetical protein